MSRRRQYCRRGAAGRRARRSLWIALAGLGASFFYGLLVTVPRADAVRSAEAARAAALAAPVAAAGLAAAAPVSGPLPESTASTPGARAATAMLTAGPHGGAPAPEAGPAPDAPPPRPGQPADAVAVLPADARQRSASSQAPGAGSCQAAMAAALASARVEFRSASADIVPASRNVISVLAALAHACPGEIAIAGHSDNLGPELANEQISMARAAAVAAAFVEFGIDARRLHPRGYGSSRPVADNATPLGRARNRRIEMTLLDGGPAATQE